MSNDKAINSNAVAVNYTMDLFVNTGLKDTKENKERLQNLHNSNVFKNELEFIKLQAERHVKTCILKYLG
jgi:hypothetical protein